MGYYAIRAYATIQKIGATTGAIAPTTGRLCISPANPHVGEQRLMPKVLEDRQNNLFIYIYTNDHIPAHVHIFKGRKNDKNHMEIKINIGSETQAPSLVYAHDRIKDKDLVIALILVANNQEMLLSKWQEIHQ
ncbi:DUF4160 domain-containing protein [Microcoleus sp. BR0-C5]|uniref:DUF4160 domain-containing protein n=1 Tax=Microcoleus sp. BR0-C5 TaxID=2818713 RepID=UPI002FD4F360